MSLDELIGSNLYDKDRMRSELTDPDPEGFLLFLTASSKIKTGISSISGKKRYLNDSLIVSSSSHPNSIIYDANEAFVVDDMETISNWSSVGTPSISLSADSSSGHFWVGSQGMKASWTETSGTAIIRSTQTYGDFSAATGVSSGTPARGTAGIWVYTDVGSTISSVSLKLGSSSGDYKKYSANFYSDLTQFEDVSLNLLLFDLDSPSESSGTVNWTEIDFVEIEWNINAAGSITFDYLTVSKSNEISLCGIGERKTTKTEFTQTY